MAVVDEFVILDAPVCVDILIEASQILANSSGVALRRGLGSSPAWPNQPVRSRPLNNASNPRGGTGSACSAESVRQTGETDGREFHARMLASRRPGVNASSGSRAESLRIK